MKRITPMKYLLAIFIISLGAGIFSFAKKPSKSKNDEPPNLLIILVDQWTGHALGFENREPVLTPNLDTNFFVTIKGEK